MILYKYMILQSFSIGLTDVSVHLTDVSFELTHISLQLTSFSLQLAETLLLKFRVIFQANPSFRSIGVL